MWKMILWFTITEIWYKSSISPSSEYYIHCYPKFCGWYCWIVVHLQIEFWIKKISQWLCFWKGNIDVQIITQNHWYIFYLYQVELYPQYYKQLPASSHSMLTNLPIAPMLNHLKGQCWLLLCMLCAIQIWSHMVNNW